MSSKLKVLTSQPSVPQNIALLKIVCRSNKVTRVHPNPFSLHLYTTYFFPWVFGHWPVMSWTYGKEEALHRLWASVMLSCGWSLSLSDSLQHHGLQPTRLLCPWDFQARILEWVAMPSSRGSSQLRVKPRSPTLQANSLPSEIPGKPKNTGVGSLSLLQGILLTQGSNRGLLPCRWMLYQLSYQESPKPKSYAHSISRTLCTGLPAICT